MFLEDLRVALGEHLGYPLIRYSSGTQPSGIRGTKVAIPKVRNLCPSKSFPSNSFERRLMPARNPIARKQKRPFTRNRHLTFKCFNGEGSERNFGDTVRSLRIRYSDHRILQIHLVLRYRSQFLVGPQPGLCNDAMTFRKYCGRWDSILSCSDHATRRCYCPVDGR
jgi:hypothetical protein